MSGKDDDKDDGYEAVVGFSVPLKRVLGSEERPENPDGSRTGSLFMTIEGCTFKEGGLHGSAAATVGAPTVVVEIVGEERDYLTSSRTSSRFVVDVHDIVETAVKAHKARMVPDAVRCRYSDCPEKHPEATGVEQVTCPRCRNDLGLPLLGASLNSSDVLRRLARLVWIKVGKMKNPLIDQMISSGRNDRVVNEQFAAWGATQVALGRALFKIVCNDGEPDLGLINRALDFLES
jgi:hypothetical protein